MSDYSLTERLLAVFDGLGIMRAHFATQSPFDIAGLVANHPHRVGGIGLVAPARMDPAPFARLTSRVLYVAPSGGMLAHTASAARPHLPSAPFTTLDGYAAESWSDIARDRPDIANLLSTHLAQMPAVDIADGKESFGEIAGIRYHALGSGQTLVLTPLSFAPSQWQPVLQELASSYRVVSLSGPHLGMLALLEQRAALTGWQKMCAGAFDALELSPGEHVLEVGCGSGATSRQFVHHTAHQNPLTAIDVSAYLLGEARIAAGPLCSAEDILTFAKASAETLPFQDDSFDAAFTITVLEECNAAKAISELIRVVKPSGRIAIVVRATDLPQWWNLPLAPEIREKIAMPAASVGPGGVANAGLYRIATAAGLEPLHLYPYTVASESVAGPVYEFPEMHALSLLNAAEKAAYEEAKAAAIADGTIFMTRGHHCFIGKAPG